jgi:hypothetical protein
VIYEYGGKRYREAQPPRRDVEEESGYGRSSFVGYVGKKNILVRKDPSVRLRIVEAEKTGS